MNRWKEGVSINFGSQENLRFYQSFRKSSWVQRWGVHACFVNVHLHLENVCIEPAWQRLAILFGGYLKLLEEGNNQVNNSEYFNNEFDEYRRTSTGSEELHWTKMQKDNAKNSRRTANFGNEWRGVAEIVKVITTKMCKMILRVTKIYALNSGNEVSLFVGSILSTTS